MRVCLCDTLSFRVSACPKIALVLKLCSLCFRVEKYVKKTSWGRKKSDISKYYDVFGLGLHAFIIISSFWLYSKWMCSGLPNQLNSKFVQRFLLVFFKMGKGAWRGESLFEGVPRQRKKPCLKTRFFLQSSFTFLPSKLH